MGSQGYAARIRGLSLTDIHTEHTNQECVKSVKSAKSPARATSPTSTPREKPEPVVLSEIREAIAETPPAEQWDIDRTAAWILAMSESERSVYYAALIHDWRAWRLAMEQFSAGEAKP
jgi:hypothetical protein